jgi:hypothetical protein
VKIRTVNDPWTTFGCIVVIVNFLAAQSAMDKAAVAVKSCVIAPASSIPKISPIAYKY